MSKLFEPMKIGSMELKNRTFMVPMSLGYESQDGTINETAVIILIQWDKKFVL